MAQRSPLARSYDWWATSDRRLSYRDRSIAGSFVSVPGTLFGVDGARAWSDALKVNAGSRLALNQYASLFASFDGEFANNGYSYGGRGGIRFSW